MHPTGLLPNNLPTLKRSAIFLFLILTLLLNLNFLSATVGFSQTTSDSNTIDSLDKNARFFQYLRERYHDIPERYFNYSYQLAKTYEQMAEYYQQKNMGSTAAKWYQKADGLYDHIISQKATDILPSLSPSILTRDRQRIQQHLQPRKETSATASIPKEPSRASSAIPHHIPQITPLEFAEPNRSTQPIREPSYYPAPSPNPTYGASYQQAIPVEVVPPEGYLLIPAPKPIYSSMVPIQPLETTQPIQPLPNKKEEATDGKLAPPIQSQPTAAGQKESSTPIEKIPLRIEFQSKITTGIQAIPVDHLVNIPFQAFYDTYLKVVYYDKNNESIDGPQGLETEMPGTAFHGFLRWNIVKIVEKVKENQQVVTKSIHHPMGIPAFRSMFPFKKEGTSPYPIEGTYMITVQEGRFSIQGSKIIVIESLPGSEPVAPPVPISPASTVNKGSTNLDPIDVKIYVEDGSVLTGALKDYKNDTYYIHTKLGDLQLKRSVVTKIIFYVEPGSYYQFRQTDGTEIKGLLQSTSETSYIIVPKNAGEQRLSKEHVVAIHRILEP